MYLTTSKIVTKHCFGAKSGRAVNERHLFRKSWVNQRYQAFFYNFLNSLLLIIDKKSVREILLLHHNQEKKLTSTTNNSNYFKKN